MTEASFMRGDLHCDRVEMRFVSLRQGGDRRFDLLRARHRMQFPPGPETLM
jgi:hypothetical protein